MQEGTYNEMRSVRFPSSFGSGPDSELIDKVLYSQKKKWGKNEDG